MNFVQKWWGFYIWIQLAITLDFIIYSKFLSFTTFLCISNCMFGCYKHSDKERRFMYKISQGHLTVFCIVFVWLGGPPSPVRIITQVPWFMYQNRLGPSGGIYYPNFVPCFVVLYLNWAEEQQTSWVHCPLVAQCFPLTDLHHFSLTKEFPKNSQRHLADRNAIYIMHC